VVEAGEGERGEAGLNRQSERTTRFGTIQECAFAAYTKQIHGGLAQGIGPALFEEISYDAEGNVSGGSFMDYYVPTAME
jgi:CO/xanthine dehydrogenase Mo-binding subunit